jgi:hypothetical protein
MNMVDGCFQLDGTAVGSAPDLFFGQRGGEKRYKNRSGHGSGQE